MFLIYKLYHRNDGNDVEWSEKETIFQAIVDSDYQKVQKSLNASDRPLITSNLRDDQDMTPLHFAADRGLPDIASLLLSNGARVNALDAEGQTPLMLAVMCDHEVCST